MDVLVVALALALGFLLGVGVGALRAFRLARMVRESEGASSVLARLMPTELPKRSVQDMVNNRVRLALGGRLFTLPVLPIGPAEEWMASVDASWKALGDAMGEASDDTPTVVDLLMAHQEELLAMLRSYDTTGVLPDDKWIRANVTRGEVFLAAIEVWRANHPLAAAVAEAASTTSPTSGATPAPSNASPRSTAGAPTTSMVP